MKLMLVDTNAQLCAEWQKSFMNFPEVTVVNTSFENIEKYDYLVSPANSYGMMDGGVDLAIIKYFGTQLQLDVLEMIRKKYYGEQPVGTAMIVPTGNILHPYLVHTPTMRVPGDIRGTTNVYTAMCALLREIASHAGVDADNKIILCMGLGTLTGRVSSEAAAYQMQLAYRHHINPPKEFNWYMAAQRERAILHKLN